MSQAQSARGFSLVELLTVVAIMAVIMGLVAVGVSGMQRPGLQTAAAQVSSGMSLARQLAITRNTTAAFIVATNTNVTGMPSEPYKYWAVITSNRGANTWTLRKDWERLPDGAVFIESLTTGYSPLNANPFPPGAAVGSPFVPSSFASTLAPQVIAGSLNTNFPASPSVSFKSDGTSQGLMGKDAVRIADGAVNSSGQVILRGTNRYFFVETDGNTGRIRVRAPESFK